KPQWHRWPGDDSCCLLLETQLQGTGPRRIRQIRMRSDRVEGRVHQYAVFYHGAGHHTLALEASLLQDAGRSRVRGKNGCEDPIYLGLAKCGLTKRDHCRGCYAAPPEGLTQPIANLS